MKLFKAQPGKPAIRWMAIVILAGLVLSGVSRCTDRNGRKMSGEKKLCEAFDGWARSHGIDSISSRSPVSFTAIPDYGTYVDTTYSMLTRRVSMLESVSRMSFDVKGLQEEALRQKGWIEGLVRSGASERLVGLEREKLQWIEKLANVEDVDARKELAETMNRLRDGIQVIEQTPGYKAAFVCSTESGQSYKLVFVSPIDKPDSLVLFGVTDMDKPQ